MKKANLILRKIRTDRGLSLLEFSCLIGISASYLCMLEKGGKEGRKLTKDIVDKIIANIPDLSTEERFNLETSIKEEEFLDTEKMQKHIMKLIMEFFYRIKKGIVEDLQQLSDEIIDLIKRLTPESRTNEMNMFSEI